MSVFLISRALVYPETACNHMGNTDRYRTSEMLEIIFVGQRVDKCKASRKRSIPSKSWPKLDSRCGLQSPQQMDDKIQAKGFRMIFVDSNLFKWLKACSQTLNELSTTLIRPQSKPGQEETANKSWKHILVPEKRIQGKQSRQKILCLFVGRKHLFCPT